MVMFTFIIIIVLHLEYIPEFDAYGIKKEIIADLTKNNELAEIVYILNVKRTT